MAEVTRLEQRIAELEAELAQAKARAGQNEPNAQQLQIIDDKIQRFLMALPIGIHMYNLDDQGRLIFERGNLAADRIVGLESSNFVGKEAEEFLPPTTRADMAASLRETAANGKAWQTEEIHYDEGRIAKAYEVHAFQTSANRMAVAFLDVTRYKKTEEEQERLHQEVTNAQRRAIEELSTPVIPVMDGIIIMPLIGSIDTMRARDITRSLLAGIREQRAKVVILDITGVPIVDSGVANHLNKTIQAARLKGAQTIVTGISDAVAETIVDLGIDWEGIETLSNLQTGLVAALSRLGIKLSKG